MPIDLSIVSLPINLAAVAYLVVAAVIDLRTNRVPNVLTLPVLLAVGAWRLWRGDWVVCLYWLGAFAVWLLHVSGGGDIKLLMIELTLWPSLTFVFVLAVTVAVLGTVVSVVRYRDVKSFWYVLRASINRWLSGAPPSAPELRFYGSPGAFLYAAGAIVYVAMLHAIQAALGGYVYGS